MFWSPEEEAAAAGTQLGLEGGGGPDREDTASDYQEHVVPLMEGHPGVFTRQVRDLSVCVCPFQGGGETRERGARGERGAGCGMPCEVVYSRQGRSTSRHPPPHTLHTLIPTTIH
jgi:hypothetical protein